jgi:hypothetical protein
MRKAPKLTFPPTCMTAHFYAACDYPKESFAQIRRRLLGAKGFQRPNYGMKMDYDRHRRV